MATTFKAKTLLGRTGIFSHEVITPNLVYNTGDQTIAGNKTFLDNIEVQGSGVFYGIDLNNVDNLSISGVAISLTYGNVNISGGWIYISGNPVLTGDRNISTLNLNNIVYTTGNQTINGLKDFTTRPTVNSTPVLLSGENANGLNVLVKNDDSITLLKGQPVYIYGANGNNILIRRASNTGEAFSSKTLGLLNQDLAPNDQGYVITEGALEGIDTNSANAGDPIWLGPTGNLIFGLANKPYAPNHLVYLGVIERKQQNNGKIYVKVQNGFELQELHNVNIDHDYSLSNNNILRYNSASGLWFNQSLSSDSSIVFTTGNQNISGNKTFLNNIEVQGTGIFNSVDLSNISEFQFSGVTMNLVNTNTYVSGGWIYISGNPVLTGSSALSTLNLNNIVYTTGNQTIAGHKTFTANSTLTVGTISGVNQSYNTNSLNLIGSNDVDFGAGVRLGGNINLKPGTGITYGVPQYGSLNLDAAGSKNQGVINLNGNVRFNNTSVSAWNNNQINFYKTGFYYGVNGVYPALTIDNDNISLNSPGGGGAGFGLVISGVPVTPALYVNTTSNQTINGLKTFTTGIDIYSETSPQSIRVFNSTGTNSGEFGLFGWQNNNLFIGSQQSQSGILRDLILTGANININASGVFNIFDNTNIIGNLNVAGIVSGLSGIFGKDQIFSGLYVSMPGGEGNIISGDHSVINGGFCNIITGVRSNINGGCCNLIHGNLNVIGGGRQNIIGQPGYPNPNQYNNLNERNVIAGGICNCIGPGSISFNNFVGGGLFNRIIHPVVGGFTFVCNNAILGGSCNSLFMGCNNNIDGGFCNCTSSTCFSSILGGCCNFLGGQNSTILYGGNNTGYYQVSAGPVVVGGDRNRIDMSISAAVLAGCDNKLYGNCSSIVGGHSNTLGNYNNNRTAHGTFIGGGGFNTITGNVANCSSITEYSSIVGGYGNKITSCYSSILGGRQNLVTHIGATVIGDGGTRDKISRGACSLSLDFNGGIFLTGSNITLAPTPPAGRIDFCDASLINATANILNVNTNFSIGAGYNSRVVLANSGSMLTGTISLGNPTGFNTSIIQIAAGQVQVTGSAGVTISSYNNQFKTAAQFATISLLHSGNNGYLMYGNTA